MSQRLPLLLLVAYLVLFALLALQPYDRAVWWAENLPIVLIVAALVGTRRWFAFSNTAYGLMAFLIMLHTIGGHYTFERVPFGWVTEFFGFSRNHFDRMAHFTVGFYAYPLAELLLRKRLVASRFVLFFFPVCFILAVAGAYEIFEWRYAVSADPTAGATHAAGCTAPLLAVCRAASSVRSPIGMSQPRPNTASPNSTATKICPVRSCNLESGLNVNGIGNLLGCAP